MMLQPSLLGNDGASNSQKQDSPKHGPAEKTMCAFGKQAFDRITSRLTLLAKKEILPLPDGFAAFCFTEINLIANVDLL